MAQGDEPGTVPSGASGEQVDPALPAPSAEPVRGGRIGRAFSGSRDLWRVVYRDPEHVSERLTLYAADRMSDPAQEWAQSTQSARPDTHRVQIADELRTDTAHVARIDGAIAGTPFFVALVPGYLSYLLQEMRMTLRTAALYDRDPGALQTSAEMLALRGVHPDVESAQAALNSVRNQPTPERPTERRSWRTWVQSGYLLLVFGGFMSPSTAEKESRGKLRAALSVLAGIGLWLTTWVLPVTFMIAMAWGCETHARQLGRRTLLFYDGEAGSVLAAIEAADQRRDGGHDKRAILRAVALFLSIAVPIGFIAYIDHVRHTVGFNWLGALGAVVALSLVIAIAAIANRR